MTSETIINFMDSAIRGSLFGICIVLWGFGIVAIWKWFIGLSKRILHWLFPKCRWFMPKAEDTNESE